MTLMAATTWQTYLGAVSLFFFAWGFYYPFQFRLLAQIDVGGRMTVLLPLMTGGGLALGPAIGGQLLAAGGTTAVCLFGMACVTASAAAAIHLHAHSSVHGEAA